MLDLDKVLEGVECKTALKPRMKKIVLTFIGEPIKQRECENEFINLLVNEKWHWQWFEEYVQKYGDIQGSPYAPFKYPPPAPTEPVDLLPALEFFKVYELKSWLELQGIKPPTARTRKKITTFMLEHVKWVDFKPTALETFNNLLNKYKIELKKQRVKALFSTLVHVVYVCRLWKEYQENSFSKRIFPYVVMFDMGETPSICAATHYYEHEKIVMTVDDSRWDSVLPIHHPFCRCSTIEYMQIHFDRENLKLAYSPPRKQTF